MKLSLLLCSVSSWDGESSLPWMVSVNWRVCSLSWRYWLAASSRWVKILSNGVVCLSNISITPFKICLAAFFLSWQTWDLTWLYDTKFEWKLKISDRNFSYPKQIIGVCRNESHAKQSIKAIPPHICYLLVFVIAYIGYFLYNKKAIIPRCIHFLSWQTWSECKGDLYGNR